ncbi:MAG: hypothetical protein AAB481_04250 [Patescibacteria group bacterium]
MLVRRSVAVSIGVLLLVVPGVWAEATAPGTLKERRTEVREAARERWEELKTNREAKREEVKANVQAKREEIKAKVESVRDERKKLVVERVQEKLGNVNEKRTDHFLKVLERLSTILDKIQSRTEKAKAEGKNVTAVETAIASARTAITTAESAVNAQKAKTYQVTVNDDTTARSDVGATTKQLQEDLRAVQDTVAAARSAVQNVFKEIKTLVGSKSTATPSATDSSAAQ